MFKWKRTPWLAVVALGALLAVAGGCGGDDDDNGGEDALVRNGTWSLTSSFSLSGTETECVGSPDPMTFSLPLCEFTDPGDLTGDDAECDVETDGNDVEFHCAEMVTEVAAPLPRTTTARALSTRRPSPWS